MPDFKTVTFAVPYRASKSWGTVEREVLISEPAEFAVPTLSMRDVKSVATVCLDDATDALPIPYVSHEGRLFRPLLRDDGRYDALGGNRRSSYPLLMFEDAWRTGHRRTNLLASPFRPGDALTDEPYVKRGAPAARQAFAEARRRVEAIVARGVVVVDGKVFHETVTPGWGFSACRRTPLTVCIPDYDESVGCTLLDPRLDVARIEETVVPMLNVGGYVRYPNIRRGRIEVHDADLLPNTAGRDALACFCVNMLNGTAGSMLRRLEYGAVTEMNALIDLVERSVRDGASLEPCLDAVRAMSKWESRGNPSGFGPDFEAQNLGRFARTFVELHDALPPAPPCPDGPVAEDAVGGFRP